MQDTKPVLRVPEVRFTLKSPNQKSKDTKVLILSVFRYEGLKLVYTSKRFVPVRYWDDKTQKCKSSIDFTDSNSINKDLKILEEKIKEIYEQNFIGKKTPVSVFRKELDYALGRTERPISKSDKTLYEFIDDQVAKNKKRVNGRVGGQTWQKLQTYKNMLAAFALEKNVSQWSYNDLDKDWFDDFIIWRDSNNISLNTYSSDIVKIKAILGDSKKHHSNKIYLDKDVAVKRVKTSKHFPKLNELKILFDYDFEGSIEKAIDLFLVSAFCGGLRWSDVMRLSKDNEVDYEGDKQIKLYTYKGRDIKEDTEVVIPITPQFRVLAKKYDWNFKKIVEEEKFSENDIGSYIREGFQLAGLDRNVVVKTGVKDEEDYSDFLYNHVTYHKARYAFINYMINEFDVPIEEMIPITGQSYEVLLGYYKGDKAKKVKKTSARINKLLNGLTIIKNEAV